MREFKKRRGYRGEILNLGLRVLGVLVLLGVTGLAVRSAWDMYTKLAEASRGDIAAQVQLATLQAQETQVANSVDIISSARGVEAQVRGRFGVARPGEGVIQIVRDAPTSTTNIAPSQHWWERLWRILFVW